MMIDRDQTIEDAMIIVILLTDTTTAEASVLIIVHVICKHRLSHTFSSLVVDLDVETWCEVTLNGFILMQVTTTAVEAIIGTGLTVESRGVDTEVQYCSLT